MSVFRSGARALITGAGSGVGLAVAQLCAKSGMSVTLVDIDRTRLETAKSTIQQSTQANVDIHDMDVSSLSAWTDLSNKVAKQPLDLLMLNAGIGAKGSWTDNDYFHKIFDTNVFGVVNGINTFFPRFANPESNVSKSIVITGSKQGITNPPGNAAYNASKSAIKTLAEHLSYDLRQVSNVSVHLLVPGWTFTGLTGGGGTKTKPDGAWDPSQVADYLYQKMKEEKFYVICPDNDVTFETDQKRMLWTAGDIVYERPPLSRWREDWKEKAAEGVKNTKI
ncbi:MAG: hypothetical protein M1820_000242 [Bogoriella megaspora]|nr:MAG: hypothetical protein M1820_000242 [Bogoriella megaspora]